jgi:eukaryotic-like serine/threonine-protein kinase
MVTGGGTVASTGALDSRLSPGSSFGRYVVESRLARGGMGEVWLATARGPGGFQKRVVIKTVLPDLAEKPGYVQMLVKEASLAARLDHPNIVHVFDLGCVGSLYYIAMEYLSGRSLAQMLRRSHDLGKRLPLRVLLSMIATSCDGLQYAHDYRDEDGHALGMLHRDISPSNIMLTFAGRVALLDFGVATASRGQYKTKSGAIKGKFHYLAPERVRGQSADRRSDIYSLGVVLYQCLTLRWPFRAQNEYELLRQIAHDTPPPVRHYAPWVTARLEQIILRAMANDAGARHQQARDLATDLRDYLRSIGAVVEPSELAACLAGLFPDAPEVVARRQIAASASSEADEGLEIIFQRGEPSHLRPGEEEEEERPEAREASAVLPEAGEPSELREAREPSVIREASESGATSESSTELDQPDPMLLAAGSPVLADAAPAAQAAQAPAPRRWAPAPDAEGPSIRRRLPSDADVDIFPEPTRSIPIADVDVFSGYASRVARPLRARSEPAFFATRRPPEESSAGTSAWPWARSLRREPDDAG